MLLFIEWASQWFITGCCAVVLLSRTPSHRCFVWLRAVAVGLEPHGAFFVSSVLTQSKWKWACAPQIALGSLLCWNCWSWISTDAASIAADCTQVQRVRMEIMIMRQRGKNTTIQLKTNCTFFFPQMNFSP